tara:strand:- start:112 stop:699 length:588 start_codon:yes stop_codon:yes gene_type:complete
MGSGISSCSHNGLVCPEGYDQEKFQKILTLYDKLDENGNMVIEQAELYVLANHHIKNKRELIEREQVKAEAENQKHILTLKLQYENDKKKLELSFKNNIKSNEEKGVKQQEDYRKQLANIDLLTKEQKFEIFKDKFTTNDNKINFDKFFEYMKTRTDDIENINWKMAGKLNHLTPDKRLSVNIESPNARPRLESP